jgi:hypothetical protein
MGGDLRRAVQRTVHWRRRHAVATEGDESIVFALDERVAATRRILEL